jgi:hypothetical protein
VGGREEGRRRREEGRRRREGETYNSSFKTISSFWNKNSYFSVFHPSRL